MNLKEIYDFTGKGGISDIFSITSNFGISDGYNCKTEKNGSGFFSDNGKFSVESKIETDNGVFLRKDSVINKSSEEMHIYDYVYRFCLKGGEYEVYTQFSTWQNESDGKWQPLVTGVTASACGIRTADGTAPFAAVWDIQSNKGIAFHIIPDCAWTINIMKKSSCTREEYTVIELGIYSKGLDLSVPPTKAAELFSVLYYEFSDKTGFDSHKLHSFFNKKYPRKKMPIIYNTWFTFFDNVDLDLIYGEIEEASKMGIEYFVIDAGWFGNGTWSDCIGDWRENLENGYKGHLKEVSDRIHSAEMKFGLWLEPERALKNVDSVKNHPDWFFSNGNSYFLDFSNEKARKYITDVTFDLIEKYSVDLIKFDFNDNITYDEKRTAFRDYHKGHIEYIKALKERYPDIYLENCASGGNRMELEQLKYFDSFWFSDNQSPYEGLGIFKNTVHRLPPCGIEKWAALISRDGFVPEYGTLDKTEKTLASNNGTWDSLVSVTPEYITGFLKGGPVGITCKLRDLSRSFKNELTDFISEYKLERSFWIDASCTVICDSKRLLALQYENGNQIKIVVYTYIISQTSLTVYPDLPEGKYVIDGENLSAEQIKANGITIKNPKNNFSYTINITKK